MFGGQRVVATVLSECKVRRGELCFDCGIVVCAGDDFSVVCHSGGGEVPVKPPLRLRVIQVASFTGPASGVLSESCGRTGGGRVEVSHMR